MLDGNDDVKAQGAAARTSVSVKLSVKFESPTDRLRRIGCWDKAEYGDHIDRKDHA
jgi:hypothetical protein